MSESQANIRKQAHVYWVGAKCNSSRLENVIVFMLPRAFCNQFDLKKKEKTNSNKETIMRKFKGASLSSVHLWC